MLAPSGGGLILYQAYGNLYAMAGRKAHLLEDKKIPSVGVFDEAKYALEILKKHGMQKGQSIGTPMATKPKLDADLSGTLIDQTDYRSKIGSLMYLTSSRPDIVLADSGFELIAFLDADHVGFLDTRKSTSGGIQFLALPEDRFQYLVRRIGMRCLTPAEPENNDKSCVAKAYGRKEMLFCDRFCDTFKASSGYLKKSICTSYMFVSAVLVYLLYGSAGVRVITAAGGRSYKENNMFKRKVATDLEAVMMISRGLGKDIFIGIVFFPYFLLVSSLFLLIVFSVTTGLTMVPPGFMVPTGLIMVSSACLVRYCLLLLLVLKHVFFALKEEMIYATEFMIQADGKVSTGHCRVDFVFTVNTSGTHVVNAG
ncbi:retrovirus-related pol polyprotein from transposon TNT 1-94 [Tanacetum coccineum]